MTYEEPGKAGGLGLMREEVEIDMGPEHLARLQSIIDPVIVSELPTMVWAPHGHDEALDALIELADVVLFDSDDSPDVVEAFDRARQLLHSAYVVDLAWLRTTPWRERLASCFDLPLRLASLREVEELEIRHRQSSVASALLLAGWMSSRLRWEHQRLELWDGRVVSGDGGVVISLETADQEAPGLAGVTVVCGDGRSLSLQRGDGGLDAHERWPGGAEQDWKILGASRGEGGILGEGVRQALLRDPIYVDALDTARDLCSPV
jgi:hypothetical protein